jgi:hypothetical protein
MPAKVAKIKLHSWEAYKPNFEELQGEAVSHPGVMIQATGELSRGEREG